MKEVFLKNQEAFKKIENPVKTNQRHVFEKATLSANHSVFDSTYLTYLKEIFFSTGCDIAYIVDGDVIIGYKKSLSKLFFTNKKPSDSIELLNFKGTLSRLLQNEKSKNPPFATPIAPKWYIVNDIESL